MAKLAPWPTTSRNATRSSNSRRVSDFHAIESRHERRHIRNSLNINAYRKMALPVLSSLEKGVDTHREVNKVVSPLSP
jgi:hypothetical protein